jgi:hypothetical protein
LINSYARLCILDLKGKNAPAILQQLKHREFALVFVSLRATDTFLVVEHLNGVEDW